MGGDLYTRDPYTEQEAARISQSILNAVAYMHEQGISHRDLKYENIMFTSPHPDADVKLIDFGLSKKYGMSGKVMHDAVGTVYSMSPQVLLGTYTMQADLWSCGILAFMLLSSTMPFYGKSRKHVLKRIIKGTYTFKSPRWTSVSEHAKNFVTSLLRYECADRPTAEKARRDPWLNMMQKGRRSQSISSIPETMDTVQASIEHFATHSTLKKLALMVVAHRSTSEDIGFLRRMFKKYDDQKGYVTLEGFKRALSEYMYSDEELEEMFRGMDVDGSGEVHYFEFLAASIESHGFIDEERLADAFDRLDADDSGTISVKDLREFLGVEVTDAYIDSIIEEEDMDDDRLVDYHEFLEMWNIESDSVREKTLETVARRRVYQSSSSLRCDKPTSSRDTDLDGIDTDISGVSSDDELLEEAGDTTFHQRKDMSIRRSSLIMPMPVKVSRAKTSGIMPMPRMIRRARTADI